MLGKKILILSHYFYPHLGGVEKHVLKTSQILADKGHQVEILTKLYQPDLLRKNLLRQEKLGKLSIFRLKIPQIKFLGLAYFWWQLLTQFWQKISQADQVIIHDIFIWYLPFKLIFPKKRVVTVMHGWEGQYPIPLKNKLLKQLAAKLSDKVICVGEYIEQYYELEADQVIYGGLDQENIVDWPLIKQKHDFEPSGKQPLKVLYLGRLAKDTGLPLFLAGLSQLRQQQPGLFNKLEVVFAGDGRQESKTNWRAQAEKYGQVLGFVDETEVRKQLKSAHACFAGGYLSALEAMAAGCLGLVGSDNVLKTDYWQLGQFRQRVDLAESADGINNFIKSILKNPQKSLTQVEDNWLFSKKQSWSNISSTFV